LGAAEVEDYEARIQKKENASQGKDPEVARLRDVIQKHQTLIANLRRTKPKVEQTITEAEEALAKAVADENIATDVRMEASKAASDMGARIDNLKAQSGSRLNAFGHKMDLVMREIDRAHWTAGKPIGPLGMHVSLTDHRYKDAFHSLMGQTLCLFAVLNDRDRSTMKETLIRCQRQ
jgi:chromosome segregation ATPase